MEELEVFLNKALKKADEAEIYSQSSRETSFSTVLDKIEAVDSSYTVGYSLRVIKDGRLGFSFFTKPLQFDNALKDALYSAKFAKKLNMSFPERQKHKKVRGLWSRKLLDTMESDLSRMVLDMLDSAKEHKAHPVQGGLSLTYSNVSMLNSKNLSYEKKETSIGASLQSQFKESQSYYFDLSRKSVDVKKIADRSSILAEKFANAKPTRGEFDVLLHPAEVSSFLAQVLIPSLDGEDVFRKKSFFVGKLGEVVANEKISIYDDPEIPYGVNSDFCDDEGTRCSRKALIEKGVLKNFMYDLEAAYLTNNKSTGHGFKTGFMDYPDIMQTNVKIESKEHEKIEEFNGVFIYGIIGMHNINPINGDFALEIVNGCFFKNGESGRAIRKCSIAGNFFELLKNLRLADDEQNCGFYYGPSWIFKAKIV